jgi:uncharacterized protein
MMKSEKFWLHKPLAEMTQREWESLCDGCGRCCLLKLEDEDTLKVYYTDVACKLLDQHACRCKDYPNRAKQVSDCVQLSPENEDGWSWMPATCAYRLVAEGHDLYWWHPLVSGDPETVHQAGVSVRGRCAGTERTIRVRDLPDHIVQWPKRIPFRAKAFVRKFSNKNV